jgi:peptidoglycan hydrolase-like amidase/putative cell wall-binding protein
VRAVAALVLSALLILGAPASALAMTNLTFTGRGWGHGIGMGQWGAYGMATKGTTPAGATASGPNIVAYYYPGSNVSATTPRWINVNLDPDANYSTSSSSYNGGYTRSSWRIRPGYAGGKVKIDGSTYGDQVHTIEAYLSAPERISHADRFTTAVAVSKKLFPNAASAPKAVVIASGDDAKFADSLTAAGLAGVADGPVLLVQTDGIASEVLSELTRLKGLGVKNAYIVGGPKSVSDAVKAKVEAKLGLSAKRIGGADRYAVAAGVAREMVARGASGSEILIASGSVWPDAALAASIAAGTSRPVLLVGRDTMPGETRKALSELGTTKTIAFGGPNTIPDAVIKQVSPAPSTRFGMWGDRFTLAAQVGTWATSYEGFNADNVYVVTAARFPDSITGGVLSGATKQPLLLTWPDSAPGGTTDWVKAHKSDIDKVTLIGGMASVGPGASGDICGPLGLGEWRLSLNDTVDLGVYAEATQASGGSPGLTQVIDGTGHYDHTYVRHRAYLIFSVNGKGKIKLLGKMPMENYLYGVVPREMPSSWHPEAVRAQAIAARSYAYTSSGELYCTTRSQVYCGHSEGKAPDKADRSNMKLLETANAAIDSTKDLVVKYKGDIIKTYFHSSSGGHTADLGDVWLKDSSWMDAHPYYRGVPDPYETLVGCTHNPWSSPVTMSGMSAAAKLAPRISGEPAGAGSSVYVTGISVARTGSGHVRTCHIRWSNGQTTYHVPGDTVRSALGLKSTVFYLSVTGS